MKPGQAGPQTHQFHPAAVQGRRPSILGKPPHVPSTDLLSVSATADLLGVHVDTVRRWTGEGKLPEVRTPGGHRRIPREAVERLRNGDAGGAALPDAGDPADQTWAHHAIVHTRHEARTRPRGAWSDALTDADRRQSRENGTRLMGLLLQHVAGTDDEPGQWAEVRRLARVYADQMRARGLSQSEALRATLFFRDALTESTAYYPHLDERPAEVRPALLRKVNGFMNEVQVAIAEAYEDAPATPPAGDLPETA